LSLFHIAWDFYGYIYLKAVRVMREHQEVLNFNALIKGAPNITEILRLLNDNKWVWKGDRYFRTQHHHWIYNTNTETDVKNAEEASVAATNNVTKAENAEEAAANNVKKAENAEEAAVAAIAATTAANDVKKAEEASVAATNDVKKAEEAHNQRKTSNRLLSHYLRHMVANRVPKRIQKKLKTQTKNNKYNTYIPPNINEDPPIRENWFSPDFVKEEIKKNATIIGMYNIKYNIKEARQKLIDGKGQKKVFAWGISRGPDGGLKASAHGGFGILEDAENVRINKIPTLVSVSTTSLVDDTDTKVENVLIDDITYKFDIANVWMVPRIEGGSKARGAYKRLNDTPLKIFGTQRNVISKGKVWFRQWLNECKTHSACNIEAINTALTYWYESRDDKTDALNKLMSDDWFSGAIQREKDANADKSLQQDSDLLETKVSNKTQI
jgi:hypothetical protein